MGSGSGEEQFSLPTNGKSVRSIAFSPSGDLLALGTTDKEIRVASLSQRAFIHTLLGHTETVRMVRWVNDDTLVSVGMDSTARRWSLASKQQTALLRLRAPPQAMQGRGNTFIAQLSDSSIVRFDANLNASLIAEPHELGVAVVANKYAIGSVGRVEVYEGGKRVRTVPGDFGAITSLAFSPDGRSLAVGGTRRTELVLPERQVQLQGHVGEVSNVRFSLDGTWLASAGDDGTVRVWDAATGAPRWHHEASRPLTNRAGDIVGTSNGSVTQAGRLLTLEEQPQGGVVFVSQVLKGSVLLGYSSGGFGVWSLPGGKRLAGGKLHGPFAEAQVDDGHFVGISSLGDRITLDTSDFSMAYCPLMQAVWRASEFVWLNEEAHPQTTVSSSTQLAWDCWKSAVKSGSQVW